VLYVAANLTEAQLLVDRLQQSGIRTYIRNEALQGALGELPLTLRPEICIIDPTDWQRAQQIKKDYERARDQGLADEELLCEVCGEQSPSNFELCWKCRRPLEVPHIDDTH